MDAPQEFHYRLPRRVGGQRPGSHAGSAIGAGQEFVAHMSLYDRPDPRRLDLRASLRTLTGDWLVRVNRQRAGIAVRALVDVSASMNFGGRRPKLEVVADFIEALGLSAFRVGDAVGMMAFDTVERTDLFVPARVSRGMGSIMAASLRALADLGAAAGDEGGASHGAARGGAGVRRTKDAKHARRTAGAPDTARTADRGYVGAASAGLEETASHLAGQQGLVFLVSDFHWPLERLSIVLDLFAHASVVPIVVWDPAETEPPERDAIASVRDAESGARRTLWLRPRVRQQWRRAVAVRRTELDSFFAAHAIRPFYVEGAFDGDALSRYFFEADA
jgi:hypothetical protein